MKLLVLAGLVAMVAGKPAINPNPMENEGLFDGDILGIDPYGDRNAIPNDSQRWPGGVVPYVISSELSGMTDLISKAMRHIEQMSCLKFVVRTTERDYIKIFRHTGCYSHWGRIGGEQKLSLGYGCENFAVVVHELLHAIGFEHEHNRSDRDDYLTINWHNIEEKWFYAFKKLLPSQNRLLSSFDFGSIMLYGSPSFAKNRNNYSMVTKDGGKYIPEIYDRTSMSNHDSYRIKILYNCF